MSVAFSICVVSFDMAREKECAERRGMERRDETSGELAANDAVELPVNRSNRAVGATRTRGTPTPGWLVGPATADDVWWHAGPLSPQAERPDR